LTITAQTQIAGVVGNPVRHSLSPIIHNAWIAAAGLDAVYLAFEPPTERFEAFVEGVRWTLLGLNVTTPFKERAFAIRDNLEEPAFVDAANLLQFGADGRIEAYSTDGEGMLWALERAGIDLTGTVVVLGAGGAARSIAHELRFGGVGEIRIVNRNRERAERLVDLDPDRTFAYAWDELSQALSGASAVINATSLGMAGQPELNFDFHDAPSTALFADIVYHPLETSFLKQARKRGQRTVDGLEMLIGQARPSFETLFACPVPDLDVRPLCEAAIRARK
jgi:shikimate dehydrogenase